MFLRVALIFPITGKLEFPPKRPILDYHYGVPSREHEELRSYPEFLEWNLGHHRKSAPSCVTLPQRSFFGEDFDETLVPDSDAELSHRLGIRLCPIKRRGGDEGAIHIPERVKGDAVLGEDSEVSVGRVVEEGRGK